MEELALARFREEIGWYGPGERVRLPFTFDNILVQPILESPSQEDRDREDIKSRARDLIRGYGRYEDIDKYQKAMIRLIRGKDSADSVEIEFTIYE